ncbi:MAG: amidohydrolase family protein, partial [Pseudomonadales bacterium]|nr:amidohydrolase family protein [Pseudomonadales bacterium]
MDRVKLLYFVACLDEIPSITAGTPYILLDLDIMVPDNDAQESNVKKNRCKARQNQQTISGGNDMSYDIVIKNGTIIDGTGNARFNADLGIVGGKIKTIGTIPASDIDSAKEVIDAAGQIVSPGFIDGHTHMDAQVSWDPLGTCSVWHGITTVVMGNCGFTLAPCAPKDKHLVVRNLERAEDISGAAMEAGIDWTWTTFPEYLDSLDRLPKGINYSGYVGHSALRTFAMGERAFTEAPTDIEMQAMKDELADSIRAGAMGFSTSRTRNHQTPNGDPVASRLASWDEVKELVGV